MRAAPVIVFWRCLALAGICGLCWPASAGLWATGYYPGYRQDYYPPSTIDFSALTHVIHFSVMPNADGTLDAAANGITSAYSAELTARAHTAGVKVLICVGGAGSQPLFESATGAAKLDGFINQLTTFMAAGGYDGIDIDWEPLDASDDLQYTNFVNALRAALNRFSPPALLTVATASEPATFAALQGQFDQINLMTYDLSGPWPGWVTWFNSPIYDGGYCFPGTTNRLPSADGMAAEFIAAGVAPAKLALGIAFYGYVWAGGTGTPSGGVTLPRQPWVSAPTNTAIAYFDILGVYYQTNFYRWDNEAQAAYLTINNPGSANDKFISYDDEHTCQAKVSYARNQHLGGVMIWELGQGYLPALPAGQRAPLLQAIKQTLNATPNFTAIRVAGQTVQMDFSTVPLGLYRVECSSDLKSGVWNVLTNNVPGTGGIVQIFDTEATGSQSGRFYRVRTPP